MGNETNQPELPSAPEPQTEGQSSSEGATVGAAPESTESAPEAPAPEPETAAPQGAASGPFRKAYRPLADDEKWLLNEIKSCAENLLSLIDHSPNGREKSLAVTKLEECVMWAVKGITG